MNKVFLCAVVVASFLISIFSYVCLPLPSEIIVHWNIHGTPDFQIKKEVALALFPIITLIGFTALSVFENKMVIGGERSNKKNIYLALFLLGLIMIASQLFVIANSLGYVANPIVVAFYLLSVCMITIGNFAAKNVSNAYVGIKNKWVFDCDKTARHVNKIFGKLFFFGGLLFLPLPLLLNEYLIEIQITYIVLTAIFVQFYSKKVWIKYN